MELNSRQTTVVVSASYYWWATKVLAVVAFAEECNKVT